MTILTIMTIITTTVSISTITTTIIVITTIMSCYEQTSWDGEGLKSMCLTAADHRRR